MSQSQSAFSYATYRTPQTHKRQPLPLDLPKGQGLGLGQVNGGGIASDYYDQHYASPLNSFTGQSQGHSTLGRSRLRSSDQYQQTYSQEAIYGVPAVGPGQYPPIPNGINGFGSGSQGPNSRRSSSSSANSSGIGGGGGMIYADPGPGPTPRIGNGFNTLPSSFYRGVRVYDPLNNVHRFKRRTNDTGYMSDSGSGSLNNFEYYRNQSQQKRSSTPVSTPKEPPSSEPTPTPVPVPEPATDYEEDDDGEQVVVDMSYPTPRKPPPENKPSLLLSNDENRFIFEILGRGRQTLATAVGRLLVPTPDQQQWQVKDSTGAVCLVRDTTKKSYFIQVFSLRAKNMIFRQEIYNQFEYQMSRPTFMTFEGDNSMVGVLFADSTEASNFREALDAKLEAKRQRRSERETRKSRVLETQVNNVPSTPLNHYASNNNVSHSISNTSSSATPPSSNNSSSYPPNNANGHGHGHSNNSHLGNNHNNSGNTISTTYTFSTATAASAFKLKKSKGKDKDKDKKKTKLTAKDIGTPMDFRHVQHVGWDPTKGFDLNLEDKDLRTFFEKAGVSANQLNDENTRKFIYNFIEQHGVADLFKKSNTSAPARAPPPVPPSNMNSSSNTAPPPVPTRTPSLPNSKYPGSNKPPPPPPPPSRPVPPPPPAATYPGGNAAGPPPPPVRTTSSAIHGHSPQQYSQHSINNGPSRPPMPKPPSQNGPSSVAPAPPPPPPPMPVAGGPPPPPPPPPPDSLPPSSSSSIPDGAVSNGPRGQSSLPVVSDDRSQLMKAIQKGVQLKKVEVDSQPKRTGGISDCLSEIQKGVDLKPVPENAKAQPSLDAMDGLAGALARALAERQKALNPDSSTDDDEDGDEYDEEEWE